MVINLQFFGGRGASSGISEKGNAYGTQYKILLEYENIKFVTNAGKNYEALMETMTNGRTYVQIGGEEILRIVQMDENNRRDDRREDLDHRDYRDRVNEPDFNIPNPVEKFAVEITLDHPYWKSFYKETGAPKFNSDQPSTIDYLDDYTQKTEGLHALAQNLMQIIDPQAQEKVIDPHASTQSQNTQSTPQPAPVQTEDPTVALPKYKALLDAGVITAEEFEAKKKQLLGL